MKVAMLFSLCAILCVLLVKSTRKQRNYRVDRDSFIYFPTDFYLDPSINVVDNRHTESLCYDCSTELTPIWKLGLFLPVLFAYFQIISYFIGTCQLSTVTSVSISPSPTTVTASTTLITTSISTTSSLTTSTYSTTVSTTSISSTTISTTSTATSTTTTTSISSTTSISTSTTVSSATTTSTSTTTQSTTATTTSISTTTSTSTSTFSTTSTSTSTSTSISTSSVTSTETVTSTSTRTTTTTRFNFIRSLQVNDGYWNDINEIANDWNSESEEQNLNLADDVSDPKSLRISEVVVTSSMTTFESE